MEVPQNQILFFALPVELQHEIVDWLSISGLGLFAQLSQTCNQFAASNNIWKRYFNKLTEGKADEVVESILWNQKRDAFGLPGASSEPGYYKALYFCCLAIHFHKCPNCVTRKQGGGWSGGSMCRVCFKKDGSLIVPVKHVMQRYALTHDEVAASLQIDTYLSPDRGIPTEYCHEYRARIAALMKYGSFEVIRREYMKTLKHSPKQPEKNLKRKREEKPDVVEEEPDPKKRRSSRLVGKSRTRYMDDSDDIL